MDKNKHLLSSAQFADLCDMEKSTLRFYRDRGILSPRVILENGYGKYEPLQGLDVANIRLLESCGFGLREIEDEDRHLYESFPYDRVLSHLEREQRSLLAKTAMLTIARRISDAAEKEDRKISICSSDSRFYLFQEYQRPSDDIEYNLIHSIKLLTRLSFSFLETFPLVIGRTIAGEDLQAGRSQKVKGLVIPVPEEIALSGEIPEEHLLRTDANDAVHMYCHEEPYSYRESYEQMFRYINGGGLAVCGDGLQLWTIGSRPDGRNTYATLIAIPVSPSKDSKALSFSFPEKVI